jgi:hypothetical protein
MYVFSARPVENHLCERLPCLKIIDKNNNNNNDNNNNGNIKFYFITILRYNLNLWNTGRRLQLWYKLEES